MKTIKVEKIIEEIPFKDGLSMVLSVLEKPKGISKNQWEEKISYDLRTGRKFFSVRELRLSERV